MKRLITISMALLVVGTVAVAQAQQGQGRGGRGGRGFGGGGGGGGESRLLSAPSVAEELKLTDDQKKEIADFREKQRANFGSFRDLSEDERRKKFEESATATKDALAKILNADQQKRLQQINLQQLGSRVLSAPEVASSINLTDDQKSKLSELRDKIRSEMEALGGGPGGGQGGGQGADREANRKKFEEMQTANRERTLSILTPEQKTKLNEMLGEPFKGEIPRGGFGGGNGGGGRGRGGNRGQGRGQGAPDNA